MLRLQYNNILLRKLSAHFLCVPFDTWVFKDETTLMFVRERLKDGEKNIFL